VCPSAACQVVLSEFTAIIDIAFGPNGDLFVLEYDENGGGVGFGLAPPAGGTLSRCDLAEDQTNSDCEVVDSDLTLPGAITFDKWGDLWLLENNIGVGGQPTVRKIN
jgi:hypothetical protein